MHLWDAVHVVTGSHSSVLKRPGLPRMQFYRVHLSASFQ